MSGPKALNEAICVPKYTIPKSEELIAELTVKKLFTILDTSSGFWHIQLDEELTAVTTFQTLCLGIRSASEIFVRKIVEIFEDIHSCISYFDDLIIAGRIEEEHYKILAQVLNVIINVMFDSTQKKLNLNA